MGRDPLDELFGFHSEAPDLRLQPDPAVLKAVVIKLRSVRKEAKGFGVPEDFLQTMTESLVECFRKLDALPRDDPFWEGTNRRPTQYKLSGFCRKMAEDDPEGEQVTILVAAVQVLIGHDFDPETWRRLIACGRARASWAVYAGLMGIHFGGYDTAPEVAQFLGKWGLGDEARLALDTLQRADDAWVRQWAESIGHSSV